METNTPFELNREIQKWREALANSPAFRRENLDELESHLRDSVATLQTRGLDAGEAFLIATRRIGKHTLLEPEFAKVNGQTVWLDRVLWMLIGLQLWGIVQSFTYIFRMALAWFAGTHYRFMHGDGLVFPIAVFSLIQMMVMAACLCLCWWLVVKRSQTLRGRLVTLLKRRSTLIVTCVGVCLFSLLVYWLSNSMRFLLLDSLGNEKRVSAMNFFGDSFGITTPIQDVALVILTFVAARKRLRLLLGKA